MPICLLVATHHKANKRPYVKRKEFIRFMQKVRNIFDVRMGHFEEKADRQPKVRSFLKGIGPKQKAMAHRASEDASPFDHVEVVRNDLSASDLDIVPLQDEEHRNDLNRLFPHTREKINDLAENRVLRGAASRLNQMLVATRSFFW